jgi:hypothetical protein
MTQYNTHPLTTFPSIEVQQRKAARRKVIEAARKLERDSYKAMMQRKRQLQVKVKDLFSAEL